MRLEPNEYVIKKKGDLETITITKEALEKWRDHYLNVAKKYKKDPCKRGYFIGKAGTLIDLLKHFEEEEG